MMGAYGAKWQSGDPDQELTGPCLGDLVIHPNYRQQGLYPKIMAFALDDLFSADFKYIFDLSSGPEIVLSLLVTGWRRIGFLQTADWQANQGKHLRRIRRYANRIPFLRSAYFLLQKKSSKLFSRQSGQQTYPFDAFDSGETLHHHRANSHVSFARRPRSLAMAKLVDRVGSYGRIRHVRDEHFFTWRYQNPLSQYLFLFWDDACLEGFLVLQISGHTHSNRLHANIVDWEVVNGRIWNDLIQSAIDSNKFDSLTIWSATLPNEFKTHLGKMGFSLLDKTGIITRDVKHPTMLAKSNDQEIPASNWVLANCHLLNLANWDLRMIYSDNF